MVRIYKKAKILSFFLLDNVLCHSFVRIVCYDISGDKDEDTIS